MSIIIHIGVFFLNIIYIVMKWILPIQDKITYISRQMNTTPLDFQMIIDCMNTKQPQYQHIVLAKMIPDSLVGKIQYCFHIFIQMYHIATSRMVILDTYCIPISILKQRKSLVVIQLWHALGALKKFGYSILDQDEGARSSTAKLMKMHYHYSYVLSSSEYASHFFAEAFHVTDDKMRIYPLPKTDLLCDESYKSGIVEHIYQKYPCLKNTDKKIIVYAPTFRKGENNLKEHVQKLIDHVDFQRYIFVLKRHPLTHFQIDDMRIIDDSFFTSLEFFYLADYIITDYSAVIFEATLLKKPIYFYAFDYSSYNQKRAFYIDYLTMMPGPIYDDSKELIKAIDENIYDETKLQKFTELMIKPYHVSYTEDLVDFMLSELKH